MACVARHSLVFSNRCSLIISHTAPLVGRDLDLNSKTLQVEGFDNVFVGGDMASGNHTSFAGHEGERTAQSAIYHGSVISRNIIRMAGGETDRSKLVQWDTSKAAHPAMALVSLGKTRTLWCSGREQGLEKQQMYESFGMQLELPREFRLLSRQRIVCLSLSLLL
jgi:NADH dehydrogenase FAD-containing subunit